MNIMQMQSEYAMNAAQTRDKISLYCGTERFQCMRELFQMTLGNAAQRQPQFAAAQAQELHGGLDGDGVDLAEERANELMQLELKRACLQEAIFKAELCQFVHFAWDDICGDGDDALAAKSHDGGGGAVVAAPDGEARRAEVEGVLNEVEVVA